MVFLRKTLMVLSLLLPTTALASGMTCLTEKQVNQKVLACEIEQHLNGCPDAVKSFQGVFSPEEISGMLIDCRKSSSDTMIGVAKNCVLPAAASLGVISRHVIARVAGGITNAYFLADIMSMAFASDKACFEDNEGKQRLIEMYNQQAADVQNYLQLSAEDSRLIDESKIITFGNPVSLERVRSLSCIELRNLLSQKERRLKGSISTLLGKKKIQANQIDEVNRILRGQKEAEFQPGILLKCLNAETIWKYRCELAALRFGVSFGSYKLMKALKSQK